MPFISKNSELDVNQTDFNEVFNFKNNTARRLYVNKFDLLPNVYFANYGLIQVLKNGFPVFETRDIENNNPLAQYSTFPLRQRLLFLDPHDTITVKALIVEDEPAKITISYVFDFIDEPAPDFLTSFSIAEKTITSRKTTLFPEQYYEKTLNQPHYSSFDNDNYNNMQIAINANIGYNPDKIEETQNQSPIDLSKFVTGYRGNNSPVRKIGAINNNGGLMSFQYDDEGERESDLLNITNLQLKTPFILNPDPVNSVFNFNHDGTKYYDVLLESNQRDITFKEYDLSTPFDMRQENRTLVATHTLRYFQVLQSIQGLFFDIVGKRFFLFATTPNNEKYLIRINTSTAFSVARLSSATASWQWPHDDIFLSLIIPNIDGCFYFLTTVAAAPTRLFLRKYQFSDTAFSNPHLVTSNVSTWTGGENYNIINAQFSQNGKILFVLAQPKTAGTNILFTVKVNNYSLILTLTPEFQTDFEYSKIILDFSTYTIIAKNQNFNINEWFIFNIQSGRGWSFYDSNNNILHPENITGEYIADITKFDTKNDTGTNRSYMFSLSSPVDFNLDINFSYLQSVSRTHIFQYKKRRRPLLSYPQTYDVFESITNQFNFKGKRVYTQIRNILRVYSSSKSDFNEQTLIYEKDNWTGEKIEVNLSTNLRFLKFEKHLVYQFLVEDYSNSLKQTRIRDVRARTLERVLTNEFSDVVEFINQLGTNGAEYLPNRWMMYYNEPLPLSMQEYAPSFNVQTVIEEPRKALFDFDVISRTPLPTPNITIGLDIKADNDEWHTIKRNIGNIAAIGKTLIELKQFDVGNNLVLPKGKGVLRATLTANEKVKLSVVAILS